MRGSQRAFVTTKLLVSFLSGALTSMLALIFDFALTCTILPCTVPKAGLGLSPIYVRALIGGLFYSHPLVYTMVYTQEGCPLEDARVGLISFRVTKIYQGKWIWLFQECHLMKSV